MTVADTSHDTSAKIAESQKPTKKHRWFRSLIWLIVILGVIAFLVNGIVARKVIDHYLNQALEDKGMNGSAEINGSISSGFEIKNLDYTGNEGIQKLTIGSASLEYKLMDLLDFKIDSIKLNKLSTTVDISKFKSSNKEKTSTDWKQYLRDIRPIVLYPNINLQDLEITILNNAQSLASTKIDRIKHANGTEEIRFQGWEISDATNLSTPTQTINFIWKENSASLDQFNILSELKFEETHLDWGGDLSGEAEIVYHDTNLKIQVDENLSIQQGDGEITTTDILQTISRFNITPNKSARELDLSLTNLSLQIPAANLSLPLPQWDLKSALTLKNSHWKQFDFTQTEIQFSQKNQEYQLEVNGELLDSPFDLNLAGKWTEPNTKKWWESTKTQLTANAALNQQILALIPATKKLPTELLLSETIFNTQIKTDIKALEVVNANAQITTENIRIKDQPIPSLSLTAKYVDNIIEFETAPSQKKTFAATGKYHLSNQDYTAAFEISTNMQDAAWLNALAQAFGSPITLEESLELKWNGKGSLSSNKNEGNLTLTKATLKQPKIEPMRMSFNGTYSLPDDINIQNLNLQQEELFVQSSLRWDGKTISIKNSEIKSNDEQIASLSAQIPYQSNIHNSQSFFAQTKPWEININTETLRLARLSELLPLPDQLSLDGTLHTSLNITGSPKKPFLNGIFDLKDLSDQWDIGLDKIFFKTTFKTENEQLQFKGKLSENSNTQNVISMNLTFPFTPHEWFNDARLAETILKKLPIRGSADINSLPLGSLSKFVPELEKVNGMLDMKARFQGTIAEPKYNIKFQAKLPIIKVKNKGVDNISDALITGEMDQTMILDSRMNAKINGGKFTIKANADLTNTEQPEFDILLLTDYALIYRDDIIVLRTNADIRAKGNLTEATISGNIGILESIFYKDIDLIPIGAPASSVKEIPLPSLNTNNKKSLPIPAPFDNWKLDLKINTTDPILIRGNLGSGQIQGSIKVKGNLSEPKLDGSLNAEKLIAKLPFSLLTIKKGRIIFRPNHGLIPHLDIQGKSQVGSYNVTMNAYGSADDPEVALSSFPALPENEIMTLIATGTTNAGLENREVATFKTLQLLLLELKQRNDRPGGNKLFSKVLSGIDNLNLKIGEKNQLTGGKYASATVKLHDRWYLSAQLYNDQPPQTRGLLIFALRFR